MGTDWRKDRIDAAHRGDNPLVMARMRSGFAVIGDTQHLPGYSLLLTDDASVDHLTDLCLGGRASSFYSTCRWSARRCGGRVGTVTFAGSTTRFLGIPCPVLHGHVHARYEWEPAERITGPVWRYPDEVRNDPEFEYSDEIHGELRAAITAELQALIDQAY